MADSSRIKRCPRCGQEAGRMICRPKSAYNKSVSYYDIYEFRVVCHQCRWTTDIYTRGDEAREAWNGGRK